MARGPAASGKMIELLAAGVPELKVADDPDPTPGYVRRIDHTTARRDVECIVAGCPRAQARETANFSYAAK